MKNTTILDDLYNDDDEAMENVISSKNNLSKQKK